MRRSTDSSLSPQRDDAPHGPGSRPESSVRIVPRAVRSAHHRVAPGVLVVLIVLVLLLALGVLGAVIKGLLWLTAIAAVLFIVAAIVGYVKFRGSRT